MTEPTTRCHGCRHDFPHSWLAPMTARLSVGERRVHYCRLCLVQHEAQLTDSRYSISRIRVELTLVGLAKPTEDYTVGQLTVHARLSRAFQLPRVRAAFLDEVSKFPADEWSLEVTDQPDERTVRYQKAVQTVEKLIAYAEERLAVAKTQEEVTRKSSLLEGLRHDLAELLAMTPDEFARAHPVRRQ